MAKGRRKKTKLTITSKDKEFLQTLAKTGRTTKELASRYFNIKPSRIDQMIREGFLKKEPIVIKKKSSYCFKLGDKGRKWVKENIGTVNNLCKPSRQGTTHDLHLFEELAKQPKVLRDAAMTEYDIINTYGCIKELSPPDLYIPPVSLKEKDGSVSYYTPQAIEIITRNYRLHEIKGKFDFCKHFLNLDRRSVKIVKASY